MLENAHSTVLAKKLNTIIIFLLKMYMIISEISKFLLFVLAYWAKFHFREQICTPLNKTEGNLFGLRASELGGGTHFLTCMYSFQRDEHTFITNNN